MESVRIVVPVGFSGGGLSMQTTTSHLGAEGVFIRCLVSPKEGAQVSLTIAIPGIPGAFDASGTVTERVNRREGGKDLGFFVQFGELKTEMRAKLTDFLRSKGIGPPLPKLTPRPPAPPASEPSPDPQRAFQRVPVRLQVGWASPKEFLVTYSENISRGGIFVSTNLPPQLREIVELLLELPDKQGPARTMAEVVQRVTVEEAKASGRVAGAGLQFIGADESFRDRLDACIDHLLTA
jgi:uncharacterized protein (TIGR02266 family)